MPNSVNWSNHKNYLSISIQTSQFQVTKSGRHLDKNFELLLPEGKNFFPFVFIDFDVNVVNRVKLEEMFSANCCS
jgi:hypothetical protein